MREDLCETVMEPERIHLLYLVPAGSTDNSAYKRAVEVVNDPQESLSV